LSSAEDTEEGAENSNKKRYERKRKSRENRRIFSLKLIPNYLFLSFTNLLSEEHPCHHTKRREVSQGKLVKSGEKELVKRGTGGTDPIRETQ